MRDRVMGVENEFGVLVEDTTAKPPKKFLTLSEFMYRLHQSTMEPAPPKGIKHLFLWSNDLWLSNGARMYYDHGQHPEYASAECRRICDLVIQSRAGEILAENVFGGIRKNRFRVLLFKNNVARRRAPGPISYVTFGCHENYLTFGIDPFANLVRKTLIPFFLTRQILDGAGRWVTEDTFILSQRALMVKNVHDAVTHPSCIPLIHILKEKSEHGSDFGERYHHMAGDANMLDVALVLKFGTTHLMLSLLEDGFTPKFERCIKPIEALERIAFHGALKKTIEFSNGDILSALEIQSMCWERVRKYLKKTSFASGASEEEAQKIHRLWEQALNAIASRDTEWMLGRLDYATKKYLAENVFCRSTNLKKSLRKKDFDILYHCMSDRTVRAYMDQQWSDRRLVTGEEIKKGLRRPPQDTRARLRGRFISAVSNRQRYLLNPLQVDWHILTAADQENNCQLPNPLGHYSDSFEYFLRNLKHKLEIKERHDILEPE